MLVEQQIAERRERAAAAIAKVLERPSGEPYGDYRVKSASGKTYRVAMRGPGLFENYCSCPDFAVNTLGTCKHIEALLLRLRQTLWQGARKPQVCAVARLHLVAVRRNHRRPIAPSRRSIACSAEVGRGSTSIRPGLLRQEHFRSFHQVIEAFRQADLDAVIYSDVLEYLDRENELAEGLDLERQLLAKLRRGRDPLNGVLKTKLLPYQERGAIFAACRGRVVLADDMGLGKTVQALAAAEMLRRRRGIQRVLVVAPASVKYQWKTEIEKFTGSSGAGNRGIAAPAAANCMPRPSSSTSPATNWS